MSFTPEVFKSYDIRGLAPQEINPSLAYTLGRVLAQKYQPKGVVVGRDMRETSPELASALMLGLTEGGAQVVDIGLCSTPVFNFAVGETPGQYDLGVMVTASHNPHPYNGFKLCQAGCRPIGFGSGMEDICERIMNEEYIFDSDKKITVQEDDSVIQRYTEFVQDKADLPVNFPLTRLAIDAGNGMAGAVLPVLSKLYPSLEVIPLYWDPDGRFPHHEANPLKPETLQSLKQVVKEQNCLFGVAFDGDADRVGIIDEQGEQIPGDILTALVAREFLRSRPGVHILYDLRSSWSTPEIIQEAEGVPRMCRVGHAHIKQQMREEQALFGGELSMHFYFSEFSNCESGDYLMLLILKILLQAKQPLSALWRPLRHYSHSGEINFKVPAPKQLIQQAEQVYAPQASQVNHLDGLRLEFKQAEHPAEDWWFSLRASNTEPLLRLNLEARSVPQMEKRKNELIQKIEEWSKG